MSRQKSLNVSMKDIVRFMWHHYRRHKWMVAGAYLFITLSSVMSLMAPFAFSWIVEAVSDTIRVQDRNMDMLIKPIAAVIGFSVLYHICVRSAHFLNSHTDSRVQASVAWETSGKVHLFETEWHANHFVGSIVTAIKRGRGAAHNMYDIFCYEFWPAIFVTTFSIVLMAYKSLVITAFFILFAICFVVFSIIISRYYVLPTNRLSSAEDSALGGTIADSITGQTVVKSFAAEKREERRLRDASNSWQRIASKAWIRINILSLSQNVVINIGRCGALIMAAYIWIKGGFTAADVIYVMMSQRVMADHLDNIGNDLNKVTTAINDMEEVVAWSNRRPSIISGDGAKPLQVKEGRIEFQNVTFFYNEQSKPALVDFSLNIAPGEKVALVGPSGGGKSTVLKLLQRLYEPQHGMIAVDGQPIADMDLTSLRSAMALVPQDPVLFHRSLRDNIAYAKPDATMDEIMAAAKDAQIADLIDGMMKKYDTLVGERGIKLSGGERQRVAIARAILADKPVLLLDEATSALDSGAEEEIQKAIALASKNRTMIAIAHRLSTIQSADRIIVLAQGRIVEQGSHRELLALEGGTYRRLYESQAKGFLPDHVA
jgi:ATP-binding cassette subfamily B protein